MNTFHAAGATAVAVNATIYAAGRAVGADFVVAAGSEATPVPLGQIVVVSFVPVVLGGFVLRAARRRTRLVEAVALIVTALSLGGPLTMASAPGTGLLLAAMHGVVCAAFLAAAENVRSGRSAILRRPRHSQTAAA